MGSYFLQFALFAFASAIRVGFLIDFESDLGSWNDTSATTWPALKAQLENNNGTVTSDNPIEVVELFSVNMTTNSSILRSQVDVMLISNGWLDIDSNFRYEAFKTVCDFVLQGGGLIFHGLFLGAIGFEIDNVTEAASMLTCSPVSLTNVTADVLSGGGLFPGWYTFPDSEMTINTNHPITEGLPEFWNGTMLPGEIAGGTAMSGASTGLSIGVGNVGFSDGVAPLNDSVIVYMVNGSGRIVFLGLPYSGAVWMGEISNIRGGTPGDRLLRQAILWSAGITSASSSSSTVAATTTSGTTTTTETTTASSSSSTGTLNYLLFGLSICLFLV